MSITGVTLSVVALVFCGNSPFSNEDPVLRRLTFTLNSQHYHPREINDEFAALVFENIFDMRTWDTNTLILYVYIKPFSSGGQL